MAKISRDSFNVTIRRPLGAVLTSGLTYWTSSDTQYTERYKYGYGVPLLQATEVTTATNVEDLEWDNLRLDLIKARTHQKGIAWVNANLGLKNDITGTNNVNDVDTGDKVLESVYTKYATVATDILTDKFLVADGEFEDITPASLASSSSTIVFSTSASWQLAINWSSAANANAFFNAGGSFTVSVDAASTGLTGNYKLQSDAILALLMSGGTPRTWTFSAADWYANTTTSSGNVWVTSTASAPYSADKLEIRAFTNVGTPGSASTLYLRVVLLSGYSGGQPVGSGAGAVGYGDSVSLLVEPIVTERHSTNTIDSPVPSSYSYGNWSSS